MVNEGKGCAFSIIAILVFSLIAGIIPKHMKNTRSARLVLQFPEVEHLLHQEKIDFEVLKTTQTVKRGIGSAKDCLYSVSRLYRLSDTGTISAALTAQISDLELLPHRPRADGRFNHVQIEASNDGMRITIEDGPWESALALFDFRCG